MRKLPISILLMILSVCGHAQETLPANDDPEIHELENHLIARIIINGKMRFYSLEERMKFYNVQGLSIAVIRNGKIAWAKGYGTTEAETNKKVNTETMFQAGSVSKPIAALTSLLVADKLNYSITEDINKWLMSRKIVKNKFEKDTVNIERILSHTAGFNVHGFYGYKQGVVVPNLTEVIAGTPPSNSQPIEVVHKPGSKWSYSGGGYEVLQLMLEDATRESFTDIAQRYLLSELEMQHSIFQHPLDEKKYTNFSEGHMEDGKLLEGKHRNHPELMAAGLWSTPTDLAKAIIEIQKSRSGSSSFISKSLGDNILTPRYNNWGLGVVLDGEETNKTFGHAGKNIGYTSNFFASVDNDFGIVIMTNSNMGFALMDEIFLGASHLYDWETHNPSNKTIVKLNEKELEKYCGNFLLENSEDERIMKISVGENGQLKIVQLWDKKIFYVFPEGEDAFFDMNKKLELKYDFSDANNIKLSNKERYQFVKVHR